MTALLTISAVCYLGIAVNLFLANNPWTAGTFILYAVANVFIIKGVS